MRKIRRAIERIDIPAIFASLIVQSLLFAKHVVIGPLLRDALANQFFRRTVGRGNQIGFTLVFNLEMLMKEIHQQSTRLASDGRHGGKEIVVGSFGHSF